jgi:uncharacterized protein (DUF1330 family)
MDGRNKSGHNYEEKLMPAYWVARSKINDPVEYKKYTDLVPGIITKFGGKVLARGGRFQIMEGPDKFHRFIVIEFPTSSRAPPVSHRRNTTRLLPSDAVAPVKSRPSWSKVCDCSRL